MKEKERQLQKIPGAQIKRKKEIQRMEENHKRNKERKKDVGRKNERQSQKK